jgi:hypothetical protein
VVGIFSSKWDFILQSSSSSLKKVNYELKQAIKPTSATTTTKIHYVMLECFAWDSMTGQFTV